VIALIDFQIQQEAGKMGCLSSKPAKEGGDSSPPPVDQQPKKGALYYFIIIFFFFFFFLSFFFLNLTALNSELGSSYGSRRTATCVLGE
jgi:hypothetical protein